MTRFASGMSAVITKSFSSTSSTISSSALSKPSSTTIYLISSEVPILTFLFDMTVVSSLNLSIAFVITGFNKFGKASASI
jgi:hypothetical protein